MYGVEHLLRHVMYVNKREELKPLKIMVADKVTFLVLAYCYKQGHHIQYDYMFRKTKFGARGHKRLIKSNYKNYDNTLILEFGKPIKELEEDKELDNAIIKFINLANSDPYILPSYIRGSIFYQLDLETIEEVGKDYTFFNLYPYWTKAEVVMFFDKKGNLNTRITEHPEIDSRIPLDKKTYQAMKKFLMYGSNPEQKIEFTRSEILTIHSLPFHEIESIQKNGCYHEPKLDLVD